MLISKCSIWQWRFRDVLELTYERGEVVWSGLFAFNRCTDQSELTVWRQIIDVFIHIFILSRYANEVYGYNGSLPSSSFSLVTNDKNPPKGQFPNSTTRARGQIANFRSRVYRALSVHLINWKENHNASIFPLVEGNTVNFVWAPARNCP